MSSGLVTILETALALVGAYLAAFWFCLVVWTVRDIRQRTHDVFVQILATILVLLFNIPGLILYLIIRPPRTLVESYARALEDESLLQGIQERLACPSCTSEVSSDFLVCPHCATALKQPCVHCGRALSLSWRLCPYCGAGAGVDERASESARASA